MVTLEQPLAQMARDGFAVIPAVFTPEQVAHMRTALAQAFHAQAAAAPVRSDAGHVYAARNILHGIRGEPLESFRYRDYGTMATIGRGSAVGEVFGVRISGFVGWLFWLFLHIFWLIGFRNRIVVMGEWAWSYVTMHRRVRLITGERLWPSAS